MTTAEILRKAREVLLNRGWAQGKVLPGNCACVAVAFACCGVDGEGGPDRGHENWLQARAIFRRVIGLPLESREYWGNGNLQMFDWNDKPGRTVEEVFDAFDRAIALASQPQAPGDGNG